MLSVELDFYAVLGGVEIGIGTLRQVSQPKRASDRE